MTTKMLYCLFLLSSTLLETLSFFSPTLLRTARLSSFQGLAIPKKYWDLSSFDFASLQGWNDFYKQQQQPLTPFFKDQNDNLDSIVEPPSFEWHSSIPASTILQHIPNKSKVIFVGNGNSLLPRTLYRAHQHQTTVICMDYSQPCIDVLKEWHPVQEYPKMRFICGDVTQLQSVIQQNLDEDQQAFDFVVDKGLMDALMCDEGFCSTVKTYVQQVAKILKVGGQMILVSYKLMPSTKEYLKEQGDQLGLNWDLDIKEWSNDRVSFSMATRI